MRRAGGDVGCGIEGSFRCGDEAGKGKNRKGT